MTTKWQPFCLSVCVHTYLHLPTSKAFLDSITYLSLFRDLIIIHELGQGGIRG